MKMGTMGDRDFELEPVFVRGKTTTHFLNVSAWINQLDREAAPWSLKPILPREYGDSYRFLSSPLCALKVVGFFI